MNYAISTHATIACAQCQKSIDESTAYYGDEGQVCTTCFEEEDLIKSVARAIKTTGRSAIGLVILAMITPYGINIALAFSALGSGAKTLSYWRSQDPLIIKARKQLNGARATAVIGMVLAVLYLLLHLVAILGFQP